MINLFDEWIVYSVGISFSLRFSIIIAYILFRPGPEFNL